MIYSLSFAHVFMDNFLKPEARISKIQIQNTSYMDMFCWLKI